MNLIKKTRSGNFCTIKQRQRVAGKREKIYKCISHFQRKGKDFSV